MTPRMFGVVAALAIATVQIGAAQAGINQRNTIAKARIGGSPNNRDGGYESTGVSGVCGEIPKEASLTGTAVFVVEFPSDAPKGPITAIAFGSTELVSGVTKATVFRLSIGVVTAKGGRPPDFVLNTDDSRQPKNSGTATLTNNKGETTLRVIGQNDMGETIDLTVVCT